ncbi:hypothetical protein [Rhizobium rhizogenes]|uniref:hypothetical protein n=1 Tax=Rhizobium rhizogenes TaxID=359 RepID=UPI0012D2A4F9|nr:hypothetical protein [Rhizobium rhizogenes]
MSNVLPFKSAAERSGHLRRHERLEKELSLPLPLMAASMGDRRRHFAPETLPTQHTTAYPQPRSPLVGLTIIAGAILVYALVTFHLVGQPHYSARANLLPALLVQN